MRRQKTRSTRRCDDRRRGSSRRLPTLEVAGLEPIGRWLIVVGLITALVGVVIALGDRIPFLGRLPGDIVIRRENGVIFIPLGTMLVVSVVVSLVVAFLNRER